MRIAAAWGLVLALAVPGLAWGAESSVQPDSALVGNGVVSLGVRRDGGIVGIGLGNVFLPNANYASSLGWGLVHASSGPTAGFGSAVVEAFSTTGTTALSVVRLEDPTSGGRFRITHHFRPAEGAPNLYEVTVAVENFGLTVLQPRYNRALSSGGTIVSVAPALGTAAAGWTVQKGATGQGMAFDVGLMQLEPGGSQVFRLFYGAAPNSGEARAALMNAGAAVVSETSGPLAVVFGYAPGLAPVAEDGAGGGGGGGDGGSGGSGGSGGAGGSGGSGGAGGDTGANTFGPSSANPVVETTPTPTATASPTSTSTPTPTATPITEVSQPQGSLGEVLKPADVISPADTPELNAFTLFGSGLLGMGSYAIAKWRSRRRK